ncbi:MAG TPA: pyridoxal-phosphate dependent enzyme [Oligoflexia bacterium]|nr:pyridoxal-phosphate dependent enzyme [Oligoflexia bacterium]
MPDPNPHQQQFLSLAPPSPKAIELAKALDLFSNMPRKELFTTETPIWRADYLSQLISSKLGKEINIFVKCDHLAIVRSQNNQTSYGGNKNRKLEFLLGDALSLEPTNKEKLVIITAGGVQSNHVLQTAIACDKLGIKCEIVYGYNLSNPKSGGPSGEGAANVGNYAQVQKLTKKIHWVERADRDKQMLALAKELTTQGKTPYIIPVGGSNGVGALGYAYGFIKLQQQLENGEAITNSIPASPTALSLSHLMGSKQSIPNSKIDKIILATSSGGTLAGIIAGASLTGYPLENILGVSIDNPKDSNFEKKIAELATECLDYIYLQKGDIDPTNPERYGLSQNKINIDYSQADIPYGVLDPLDPRAHLIVFAMDAIYKEGIIEADPVYTGKALAAMITMAEQPESPLSKLKDGDQILYIHTGGSGANPAYEDEIKKICPLYFRRLKS